MSSVSITMRSSFSFCTALNAQCTCLGERLFHFQKTETSSWSEPCISPKRQDDSHLRPPEPFSALLPHLYPQNYTFWLLPKPRNMTFPLQLSSIAGNLSLDFRVKKNFQAKSRSCCSTIIQLWSLLCFPSLHHYGNPVVTVTGTNTFLSFIWSAFMSSCEKMKSRATTLSWQDGQISP